MTKQELEKKMSEVSAATKTATANKDFKEVARLLEVRRQLLAKWNEICFAEMEK